MLPVALVVTAVLAGVVVTGAQSLLLVLIDRPIVARPRASGHYEALVGYFWEAARSMVWCVAVSISILVLNACGSRLPSHDRLVPALLAGCFAWVWLSGLRASRLVFKLLVHRD